MPRRNVMTLGSILLLGLVLGVRHSLEADHIAAVAALTTRASSVRSVLRLATSWGVGHAASLVAVAAAAMLIGARLPAMLEQRLEAIVGVMLVVLGADVLRRLYARRVHIHVHEHDGGGRHVHFHAHAHDDEHDPTRHEHSHAYSPVARALLVGGVHGLAGSAALVLVAAGQASSPVEALVFLIVFGAGATIGMLAFSLALSLPLRSAARLGRWIVAVEGTLGIATIAIGIRILTKGS